MKLWMAVDTYINTYESKEIVLGHNFMSDWTPEEKQAILGKRSSNQSGAKTGAAPVSATKTCNDGFFLSGNKCLACGSGCRKCSSATTCTECWTSNFLLSGGKCSCSTN
jgi:hypothetical protein